MKNRKSTNPFYVAALPVGVLFVITACAYVVMTIQGLDPQRQESAGLMDLLAKHGTLIFIAELGLLAIFVIAAIATDEYWTGSGNNS